MVGRAVIRRFMADGFTNVFTATRSELDLLNQQAVREYIQAGQFQHVVIAAARVGGILLNMNEPVQQGYENGMIMLNLLDACHHSDVERVMFLGSSCIYPRECRQPMLEEDLLTGSLEPTNELYAVAKIFGLRMVDAYRAQFDRRWISCQPCNLYGPFDNFDPQSSHFLPALIRKLHLARVQGDTSVECWGTGSVRREVLHVDDLADSIVFLMNRYDGPFVNVGSGVEHTIRELTELVADVVGYDGEFAWNPERPEGMPRKLLDVSKISSLGWKPRIELRDGIRATYDWWLQSGDCGGQSVGSLLAG